MKKYKKIQTAILILMGKTTEGDNKWTWTTF